MPDIPPWIRSAEPAPLFSQGVQIGGNIAAEQQRIQIAAMQLEANQRNAEMDHLLKQQQNEITKAYNQAQIGVERQKVETARMEFERKTMMAARQMQAMNAYMADIQGGQFNEFQAASRHPEMFLGESGNISGFGPMMRPPSRASVPKSITGTRTDPSMPGSVIIQKSDGSEEVRNITESPEQRHAAEQKRMSAAFQEADIKKDERDIQTMEENIRRGTVYADRAAVEAAKGEILIKKRAVNQWYLESGRAPKYPEVLMTGPWAKLPSAKYEPPKEDKKKKTQTVETPRSSSSSADYDYTWRPGVGFIPRE